MVTEQDLGALQHFFSNNDAARYGIYRSFHGTRILIEEQVFYALPV